MKGIVRLVLAGSLAVLAAVAGSTSSATAGLVTCNESSERPFEAWGDMSPYALAPNGSLEDGSTGWTLSGGARVVGNNNALRPGSNSLSIPEGGSATSPAACVKLADPASRFFLRRKSGGDGKLRVDVQYRTVLGLVMTSNLGYATPGGSWQPGPKYQHELVNILGALALNGDLSASIRFKFTAINASYHVDDLFVDPLIQG